MRLATVDEATPVEEPDLDALFPDLWPDLEAGNKRAIQQTIENSDTAWLTADFNKFAREWSFEFQPNVPTRQDWSELLNKHAGLWRRWQSSVLEMVKWDGVMVRFASNVFTGERPTDPKMVNRSTLRIQVKYLAEWADNGDVWEGNAEFYLMRLGRKYRILHWGFPLEEMKAAHALKEENQTASPP